MRARRLEVSGSGGVEVRVDHVGRRLVPGEHPHLRPLVDPHGVADAYVAYRAAAKLEPTNLRAVSGLATTAEDLGFAEESRAARARRTELERLLGPVPGNQ